MHYRNPYLLLFGTFFLRNTLNNPFKSQFLTEDYIFNSTLFPAVSQTATIFVTFSMSAPYNALD